MVSRQEETVLAVRKGKKTEVKKQADLILTNRLSSKDGRGTAAREPDSDRF